MCCLGSIGRTGLVRRMVDQPWCVIIFLFLSSSSRPFSRMVGMEGRRMDRSREPLVGRGTSARLVWSQWVLLSV